MVIWMQDDFLKGECFDIVIADYLLGPNSWLRSLFSSRIIWKTPTP